MSYDSTRCITDAQTCVPSDTTVSLRFGFYVGVTGNVAVVPYAQEKGPNSNVVIFENLPAGKEMRDFMITRVMSTGTTATGIVTYGPSATGPKAE